MKSDRSNSKGNTSKFTFDNTPKFEYQLAEGPPPSDIDLEADVLGAVMTDPQGIKRVYDYLTPDTFYSLDHKDIYQACLELHGKGQVTDFHSVAVQLARTNKLEKIGGRTKVASCVEQQLYLFDLENQAKTLMQLHSLRQMRTLSYQIPSFLRAPIEPDKVLEAVEEQVMKITRSPARWGSRTEARIQQHNRLLDEIHDIEINEERSSLRYARKIDLSKQYGLRLEQIEDIYFKSLVDALNEPFMTMAQAQEKYGGQITEWFMNGLIPKGETILLSADGGTGKTMLAHDLMFRLMTGTNLDEFSVTKSSRRCLYIQTDTPASTALVMMAERGVEVGMPIEMTFTWSMEHIPQLKKKIIECGAEVIIIDSLTSANRYSTVSENDVAYARPILQLNAIAQELGVTFMILHHTNKEGKSRGSTAIFAAVSTALEMKRDPAEPSLRSTKRIITIPKSRTRCPDAFHSDFNPEDKSWSFKKIEQEDQPMTTATKREEIIDFLRRNPNTPFEATELTERLGGSNNHVRTTLYELADEGVVSKKRKYRNKPFQFFIEFADLSQKDGTANDQQDDQPANARRTSGTASVDPLIHENHDFGENKKSQNNGKNEIYGSTKAENVTEREKAADHNGRSPHNFFGDLSENRSINILNRDLSGNHIGDNYNGFDSHSLAEPKFKVGDRVRYVGDQPAFKGKELIIAKPAHKDTCLDYSYTCTDPAKPKAFTPRFKEDDLRKIDE